MVVAVALGLVAGHEIRLLVSPSGSIQPTLTTPVAQQLSTDFVIELFGVPYAALVAASLTYFALHRGRPWAYAVGGTVGGVLVYCAWASLSLKLGTWWVNDVSPDTNRAAVLFTLLVGTPGILAGVLATQAAAGAALRAGAGPLLRCIWIGTLLGLLGGALVGVETAVQTWAIHCPQNGLSNCASLSSVQSSGAFLGGLLGAALGAACGVIPYVFRSAVATTPPVSG